MANFNKRRLLISVLSLVLMLGIAAGTVGAQSHADELFGRIRTVYEVVESWHKNGADLNTFIDGAIRGGLEALGDPYTNYYPPEEYQPFLDSLNSIFSGIGAYLEQDGNYVVITAPIKGTPAAAAGLMSGDRILEADGVSLVGATVETAVRLIRGPAGTGVTLKIERPSESRTLTVTVNRAEIHIPQVESRMLDGQIGYLQLSAFGAESVQQFYAAADSLKAQGARGIVLDLRNNGGGYLNAAVDIASAFVPAGEPVLWQVGRDGKSSMNSTGQVIGLPVVVLVNEGTASASEILAGAIQDHEIGPLVGIETFGKGTVQTILTLEDGSGLKVTTAEYLTAKERKVDGVGLTPDHVVEPKRPDPERTDPMEFTRFLRTGTVGLDVLRLQNRLSDLGFQPDLEGYFGLKTREAVNSFARHYGLAAESMVDGAFLQVLNAKVEENAWRSYGADSQLDRALQLMREQISQ